MGVLNFFRHFEVVIVVAVLLSMLCFTCSVPPFHSRLGKRIANGFPLSSHQDFGTYHFISLREMFRCITDQKVHVVDGCDENNSCAGTLFHPEFVITAGHCAPYLEYYLRGTSDIYSPQSEFINEDDYKRRKDSTDGVKVQIVTPRIKHAFYSNTALLAGNVKFFAPEQKRHAFKTFPHPAWTDEAKTTYYKHDVAIIQACQPFDITENVRLAPMLPLEELPAHYDGLIKRAGVCLHVGFGLTDEEARTGIELRSGDVIPSLILRYTWRKTTCVSRCYFNEDPPLPWDAPREPCFLCSDYIPPRLGTTLKGDSGGPIVCDGYYVGVLTGGNYTPVLNYSKIRGYPLHCIKDAITSESLDDYRAISPSGGGIHHLGPVPGYEYHRD